jgi:hypothetical protein
MWRAGGIADFKAVPQSLSKTFKLSVSKTGAQGGATSITLLHQLLFCITTMSLVDTHRLHISGGTFNQVAGHLNEYHVAGNLIQPHGENGELDLKLSPGFV